MKLLICFANYFAKGVTNLNHLLAKSVAILVFAMVIMISYDVICRYFFNAPTVWAMELATMLFGPYFMLSGAYVLHIAGHVNVEVLYDKFSPSVQAWTNRLIYLVILSLCIMFTIISWPIAIDAWQGGETTFSSWNPVIWPVKITIPVAFSLVGLQAIAEIIFSFMHPSDTEIASAQTSAKATSEVTS